MRKLSPNALCPCESGKKYKKCCKIYHDGTFAPDALALMKSRYCAFAVGKSDYIIKTTHPANRDFTTNTAEWKASIDSFCRTTKFYGLGIFEFVDGKREAFVSFAARLDTGILQERSRFVKEDGRWLYIAAC